MLSPENPTCSPEALGKPPVARTRCYYSLSFTVAISSTFSFAARSAIRPVSSQSTCLPVLCRAGGTLTQVKGCHCRESIRSLTLMIDGLYVCVCVCGCVCTRTRTDAQYDASIRDLRNCDDLTLLLALIQTRQTNTRCKTNQNPIFRNHGWGLVHLGCGRLVVRRLSWPPTALTLAVCAAVAVAVQ